MTDSHTISLHIQDRLADSHAASPPGAAQDRFPSHASSPFIHEMTDSHAISFYIQDRLPFHASSPLIQEMADSHAASPPVQDRFPSHASSPLIQDKADSHAASPPVKDRFPSHASSPLVPDRSKTQVGQQSQLLSLTPSNTDTCKILDVHLALHKRRDTTSISKPLDNTKGMKFYFKPVKKSKPDHSLLLRTNLSLFQVH